MLQGLRVSLRRPIRSLRVVVAVLGFQAWRLKRSYLAVRFSEQPFRSLRLFFFLASLVAALALCGSVAVCGPSPGGLRGG